MQAFLSSRSDLTSSESTKVRSLIFCSSCLWEYDETLCLFSSCRSYISLRTVERSLGPAIVHLFCTFLSFFGYSGVRSWVITNTAEVHTSLGSDRDVLSGELSIFGDRRAGLIAFTDNSSSLLPITMISLSGGNKIDFSFPLVVLDRDREHSCRLNVCPLISVGDSSSSTKYYNLHLRHTPNCSPSA